MQIEVRDTKATMTVADECFDATYREALVHQVVVTYAQRGRQGDAAQKNRAAVRGGGAKPWRQKGTGRARAGSIRSPLWRGGGVTHPSSKRIYNPKLNKKMYRQAMRSIFSELLRQGRLHVIEEFTLTEPKTRIAHEKLAQLGLKSALILVDKMDENVFLAIRNMPHFDACEATAADPVNLLRYEQVVATRAALNQIEARLGGEAS